MSAPVLRLGEADIPGVGGKARSLARLAALRPTLFSVPRGIVARGGLRLDRDGPRMEALLEDIGRGPYAVRSSGLAEDGSTHSLAGRYRTELNVPRGEVAAAVTRVFASLEAADDRGDVLIQEMVAPTLAGVLFTRSPQNAGIAACEFTEGLGDAVVSGTVQPHRAEYGRYTGRISWAGDRATAAALERVFLVGGIVEQRWGVPLDIEWAYERATDRLFVLQLRPITATAVAAEVTKEQERVARSAVRTTHGPTGQAVFHDAAVSEVVATPSRMTRSLIERLYSPAGSLGRAFTSLGFPQPVAAGCYVVSVFGKLYTDREVERRLFGPSLRTWWAGRRIRQRLTRDSTGLVAELSGRIEAGAGCEAAEPYHGVDPREHARRALETADRFVDTVYPPAYAATIVAQLAGERAAGRSTTSRLLHDLSRLHHTGDSAAFLARWGHRSANDYELSEPRFAEDPQRALRYAAGFRALPWDRPGEGDAGPITDLKEHAKDLAVRWLGHLRAALIRLERVMGLADGEIFLLDLEDIASIAAGGTATIAPLLRSRRSSAHAWSGIDLGDAPTLGDIERLGSSPAPSAVLCASMIAARAPFQGRVRIVRDGDTAPASPAPETPVVLVARYLRPELAGYFPGTAGCLVDIGGTLSHAAILAREQDYPIAVLPGASSTLTDGDYVEVGASGELRIRREQAPAEVGTIELQLDATEPARADESPTGLERLQTPDDLGLVGVERQ